MLCVVYPRNIIITFLLVYSVGLIAFDEEREREREREISLSTHHNNNL